MVKIKMRKMLMIILIGLFMLMDQYHSHRNDSASVDNLEIKKASFGSVMSPHHIVDIIKSVFGSNLSNEGERKKRTSDLGSIIFAGK